MGWGLRDLSPGIRRVLVGRSRWWWGLRDLGPGIREVLVGRSRVGSRLSGVVRHAWVNRLSSVVLHDIAVMTRLAVE